MSKRRMEDEALLNPYVWIDGLPITKSALDAGDAQIVEEWRVLVGEQYIARTFIVPFYTDFASIPWWIRALLPRLFGSTGIYRLPAIVHDLLYFQGMVELDGEKLPVTKAEADEWFYQLMVSVINSVHLNVTVRWFYRQRARLMFQMVKSFGGSTWDNYRSNQ